MPAVQQRRAALEITEGGVPHKRAVAEHPDVLVGLDAGQHAGPGLGALLFGVRAHDAKPPRLLGDPFEQPVAYAIPSVFHGEICRASSGKIKPEPAGGATSYFETAAGAASSA
jgi:hypothetical protein